MKPLAPSNHPVLITGCAGGIGRSTVRQLLDSGYKVVATVFGDEEVGSLEDEFESLGDRLRVRSLDIRDAKSVESLVNEIGAKDGGVRALINNAGIGIGGFLEDLSDRELAEVFEINVFATARLTRLVLPLLRRDAAKSLRHIIVMSSLAGRVGAPGISAYHASKFALEGLFSCLDLELGPEGIKVVLMEPGLVKSSFIQRSFRLCDRTREGNSRVQQRCDYLWEDMQHRFENKSQSPEQVAAAILLALGDANPPLRWPVGSDARVILLIQKLLPTRWFDALWRKVNK